MSMKNLLRGLIFLIVTCPVFSIIYAQDGYIDYNETITDSVRRETGVFYSFDGNADDTISISLESDDFDTYLELYRGDTIIASDDDSGNDTNSRISNFVLPRSGSYDIGIRAFGGGRFSGSFTLTLTLETNTEPDSDNTISYDESITDRARRETGVFYSFEGNADDTISISLESDDFDTYLELYRGDTVIAYDDDSGDDTNSRISNFVLPRTDTYWIGVRAFGGGSFSGSFRLSLTLETNTASDTYYTINYNEVVVATVSNQTEIFYSFEGNRNDRITITLASSDFDTYLELYEGSEFLLDDDDSGGNRNSLISDYQLPSTGTYWIGVRAYGGGSFSGTFSLHLSVPAAAASNDRDLDGIINSEDSCPRRPGPASNAGCPMQS